MAHNSHPGRIAASCLFCIGLSCEAAEWVAEPSVSLREEYNDNIRLTNANHDSVWGTELEPQLKLSRKSALWDLYAIGKIRAERYSGQDGLDTTDSFLDIGTKRTYERGNWEATASLINDTTLQNELLDFDTGITINQIDREQQKYRLSGSYLFTEANWVEVWVDYSSLDYDDGEQFGLLDYDVIAPGVRIIHQYSPKTQFFGILNHSKVDYDTTTELESKTNSLQIGSAYDITETWSISASVGGRKTTTSDIAPTGEYTVISIFPLRVEPVLAPRERDSTGLVYSVDLTHELETGYLKLSGSRSVTPSSTGTDSDSTTVSLDVLQRFSPKLSAKLFASYYQSRTVGDITTGTDIDRYRISPSLAWHLDEAATLNVGYIYTRVERKSNNTETDSNAAYINFSYDWPRIAVSR